VRSGIKSNATSPEPGPQWRWFVEQAKTSDGELIAPLTTWLALGQDGDWAFTRQCLRVDYCLNLQPWP
jgi:alanine-alpha-ketoisovalerate/valine-pyruvate aminotransferase